VAKSSSCTQSTRARSSTADDAPAAPPVAPPAAAGRTRRDAIEDYERLVIGRALADAGGSWAAAARALGMHRSNLHHRAVRLGLREGITARWSRGARAAK
jgi:transcriptional regulator with GAF, ATPase, and Fis domain